jgi:hypothetical protein
MRDVSHIPDGMKDLTMPRMPTRVELAPLNDGGAERNESGWKSRREWARFTAGKPGQTVTVT